jgi:hypothetical protein
LELPQVYECLESVLGRLGVAVRSEPFDPRMFGNLGAHGGMCRVHGSCVVLVDSHAPIADRVAVLAQVLSGFDLSDVYLPPQVRDLIDSQGSDRAPRMAQVIPLRKARGRARN